MFKKSIFIFVCLFLIFFIFVPCKLWATQLHYSAFSEIRTRSDELGLLSPFLSSYPLGNMSLYGVVPYSLPTLGIPQYNNMTSYNTPLFGASSLSQSFIPSWNMSLFGTIPNSYPSLGIPQYNNMISNYTPLSGKSSSVLPSYGMSPLNIMPLYNTPLFGQWNNIGFASGGISGGLPFALSVSAPQSSNGLPYQTPMDNDNTGGEIRPYNSNELDLSISSNASFADKLEAMMCPSEFNKTSLEIRGNYNFHEELKGSYLVINQPRTIQFVWETEEEEATCAYWEIISSSNHRILEGWSNRGPSGGAYIYIDFRKFLPDTPPEGGMCFFMRVQPMKEPDPEFGSSSPGPLGEITWIDGIPQLNLEPVGQPSCWVMIAYTKDPYEPTEFDDPVEYGYYEKIEFCTKYIKCIEETSGPGSDEIYLAKLLVMPDGDAQDEGLWTVSTDFDEGEIVYGKGVSCCWYFYPQYFQNLSVHNPLCDPWGQPWPRDYVIALTMWEGDNSSISSGESSSDKANAKLIEIICDGAAEVGKYFSPFDVIDDAIDDLLDWVADAIINPSDILDVVPYKLRLQDNKCSYIHSLPGSVKFKDPWTPEFESDPFIIRFEGDGGEYKMKAFWRATNAVGYEWNLPTYQGQ